MTTAHQRRQRFIAGEKQAVVDVSGQRRYDGIDEHKPFAEGRTEKSASANYMALRLWPPLAQAVWDRKLQRYVSSATDGRGAGG